MDKTAAYTVLNEYTNLKVKLADLTTTFSAIEHFSGFSPPTEKTDMDTWKEHVEDCIDLIVRCEEAIIVDLYHQSIGDDLP